MNREACQMCGGTAIPVAWGDTMSIEFSQCTKCENRWHLENASPAQKARSEIFVKRGQVRAMKLVHVHDETRVVDPVNGHEWVICNCGFALDLHVLRGKSA